ncbi:MAG: hypothetical protein JWO81_3363 [Alphaproteobacteria bacterium]|nr:hypothetical protein [Alphaproteobacteria bacterium]
MGGARGGLAGAGTPVARRSFPDRLGRLGPRTGVKGVAEGRDPDEGMVQDRAKADG